jgi:hypothetical protein
MNRFVKILCRSCVHHNNNTFTWSGPSGVLDCTGQRRVAPAEGMVHVRATVVAEEKDYDPGLGEGDHMSHTYPVNPEPTTPRKRPALLARVLDSS